MMTAFCTGTGIRKLTAATAVTVVIALSGGASTQERSATSAMSLPLDFGAAGRITADGNWLLGAQSHGQPYTRLLVSQNASPIPPGDSQTIAHFAAADDRASRVLFDGFSRHLVLVFRRAHGTAANPTAVREGDSFASIGGTGYGSTRYNSGPSSAKVAIDFRAAETWTDDAQGTFFTIETTAIGTKQRQERVRVDDAGNVVINSGFLYVPTTAGAPSGMPRDYPGHAPIVVDATNHKLYFFSGGAWREAGR